MNAASQPPGAPSPPPTILVADDEPQIRQMVGETLEALGYRILQTGDGHATIRQAIEVQPDLILLDIRMPGPSGIDVCNHLRALPETRGIGIIVITGLEATVNLEESIIAGADDLIAKPIDPQDLAVRVRALLQVRHITNSEKRTQAYLDALQTLRNQPPSTT